jgi:hypothetical protein
MMNGFSIDMWLMWVAIGGTLGVAAVADTWVLLALAARCWAMLMRAMKRINKEIWAALARPPAENSEVPKPNHHERT